MIFECQSSALTKVLEDFAKISEHRSVVSSWKRNDTEPEIYLITMGQEKLYLSYKGQKSIIQSENLVLGSATIPFQVFAKQISSVNGMIHVDMTNDEMSIYQ